MALKCIGCGSIIPWDGKGLFCYTCPCGATVFYNEDTKGLMLPISLIRAIHKGKTTPHLDYYVGDSDYTSPTKEQFIKELLDKGFIWMKDCKQCLEDGTYQKKLDRETHLAVLEAESLLRNSPPKELA